MINFSCVEGQAIVIGEHLVVTVLEIDGDDVLLEINAPDGIDISGELELAACAGLA